MALMYWTAVLAHYCDVPVIAAHILQTTLALQEMAPGDMGEREPGIEFAALFT